METTEIAIVGASFAGLSAALTLGRSRRLVTVFGSGPPRNEPAAHAHTFLTRDGTRPADLLAAAIVDADRYPTVTRLERAITGLVFEEPTDSFVLTNDAGDAVRARRVILATGVRDVLPDIAGLAGLWGRRAHSCPYCDGYEYADRRLAVVGTDARIGHIALMLRQWTPHVTMCGDPTVETPTPTGVTRIAAATTIVEHGPDLIVRAGIGGGQVEEVVVDGVFVVPTLEPQADLAVQVGAELRDGFVVVDAEYASSVPGLWVVGDVAVGRDATMPYGGVAQAVGAGNRAAIAINGALIIGDAAASAGAQAAR